MEAEAVTVSSCREANERRVCHRAAETSRSHLPSILTVLLSDLNNNNPDRVPLACFMMITLLLLPPPTLMPPPQALILLR